MSRQDDIVMRHVGTCVESVTFVVVLLISTACAAGPQYRGHCGHLFAGGFWMGLWEGLISPSGS